MFWREILQLDPTLFAPITTLEVWGAGFPSFYGLKQMLLAMPQLTVLRLDGSSWTKPPDGYHGSSHTLRLEKLDLRSNTPNDFIEWFVQGLSPDEITGRQGLPEKLYIQEKVLKMGDGYLEALLKNSRHLHLYTANTCTPVLCAALCERQN